MPSETFWHIEVEEKGVQQRKQPDKGIDIVESAGARDKAKLQTGALRTLLPL